MSDLGLWSKKAEKGCGQFIDDKVVFKNAKFGWAIEAVDGLIASQSVSFIDDSFAEKLPAAFVPTYIKIGKVFEEYDDNKDLVFSDFILPEEIAIILDGLIDIPKISDDAEVIFFAGITKGIFDIIDKLIKKD